MLELFKGIREEAKPISEPEVGVLANILHQIIYSYLDDVHWHYGLRPQF